VYRLTESLFAHKAELVREQRLLAHLDEHFDLSASPYALHDGADQYLRRHEPTLLQRYTDQISLFITVAALVWSGVSAFQATRARRRKNRIEVRHQEALAIVKRLRAAEGRERAVELADERLDANEGFTVLQRYIESQLREARLPDAADQAPPDDPARPAA
jgi:hypothetical protein